MIYSRFTHDLLSVIKNKPPYFRNITREIRAFRLVGELKSSPTWSSLCQDLFSLKILIRLFLPCSRVPAFLNVVDIAGLVKGASEGQGKLLLSLSLSGQIDQRWSLVWTFIGWYRSVHLLSSRYIVCTYLANMTSAILVNTSRLWLK